MRRGDLPWRCVIRKIAKLAACSIAALAFVTTASAETSKPRVLVIDGKELKVWGVPANQHFTKNHLFPNPTQRCPTLLVRADIVTDSAILAKHRVPRGDYLYHFVCLQSSPAGAVSAQGEQRPQGQIRQQ